MERLNAAAALAHMTEGKESKTELEAARVRAARLMQQLAALLPLVAAQARVPAAVEGWVDSWARQIQLHQLSDEDLAAGVAAIGGLPADQPFSFSWFLAAVKAARPPLPRLAPPPVRLEDLAGWTPEAQSRGQELIDAMRARRKEGQHETG